MTIKIMNKNKEDLPEVLDSFRNWIEKHYSVDLWIIAVDKR